MKKNKDIRPRITEDEYAILCELRDNGDIPQSANQVRTITQLRAENRALTKQSADSTLYKKLIHGVTNAHANPPKWIDKAPSGSGFFYGTPTLFLSDLHWGETVHPSQINYVNEYNLDIARVRLRRFFSTSIQMLFDGVAKPKYNGIVLALGGDMLSGNIHEELRESNGETLFQSVLSLTDELIAGVSLCADRFGRVFVPGVVGNHGRLDRKPRMKSGVFDNADWLLYQIIARHFANDKRVTFMIPDSFNAIYKLNGRTYHLQHGDEMRGGNAISGPITAWMLANIRKQKRHAATGIHVDTFIFGHFHQLVYGQNNSFIGNGSGKGYDEFAAKLSFPFERARQALWVTAPNGDIPLKLEVYGDEARDVKDAEWVQIPDERT